ncbi:hypothetical protein N1851_011116 [Merluccius polli]|uniref:Uncharacterized protein n=1 Tax=Merluccius polli TaxID=89951 RepID=A0AA47MXX4_MERPO|nr:hypothetical protein N1851_011116 [Merluccius polli]
MLLEDLANGAIRRERVFREREDLLANDDNWLMSRFRISHGIYSLTHMLPLISFLFIWIPADGTRENLPPRLHVIYHNLQLRLCEMSFRSFVHACVIPIECKLTQGLAYFRKDVILKESIKQKDK